MSKKPTKKKLASVTPKSLPTVDLFGPPPIIEEEDAVAYKAMCERFFDEVSPKDLIEKIWVQDVVYHTFRMQKMRRQLAVLLSANQYRGVKELLEPLCGYKSAGELADGWAQGDEEAIERVEELFDGAGFTIEMVQAQTLSAIIKDVERVEQLIGNAEACRNSVLREIEYRRSRLASALHKAAEPEDAQFKEIEPRRLVTPFEGKPPAEMVGQEVFSEVADTNIVELGDAEEAPQSVQDEHRSDANYIEAAE